MREAWGLQRLTGSDRILAELYRIIPPGIKVIDHAFARVFWDLNKVERSLRNQLKEKTELEEKLKRDQKRLQDIINSLGDAVIVMNREMIIEAVNAEYAAMTGIPEDSVLGQRCGGQACGRGDPGTGKDNPCLFEEVIREGKPRRCLHIVGGAEGRESYYEVSATPLFDADGDLVRVVETFHRVTEQVRLKRETKESAQRFRQFIDSAHDLIIMKDLEGRYLVINRRAARLFDRSPEECIGKTDRELFGPRMGEMFSRRDREVIESRQHISRKEVLELGENKRYLDTFRFPLLDYKGDCRGVCSISRDVTEQRSLERGLIESAKFAALGKLAAGVAHEINNPLSGILSFIEDLLQDVEDGDPRKRDYEVILREALRCRRIVRDLLDYARLQKPVRCPVQINDVVRRVLNMVSNQAAFRNIELSMDLSSPMRPVNIDSGQMQQVLLNLVINAVDAMNGKGRVAVATRYLGAPRKVLVSVSDHGCGIPAGNLGRIFEPFFSTKGPQGNGLGLTVVTSIVEQHGGKVDIDTELGRGTTFRISLPVSEP